MKLVKFVVKKVIRGLLKIIVVYKEVEAYEEQRILEDVDTDHRDSADGTGYYAGSDQLYVKEMRVGQKFDLPSFLLLANNHLIGVHCCRWTPTCSSCRRW